MPAYVKDQPSGFVNRIERVAIVGAGGQIGRPITEALLQTGKHTVTALTRGSGSSTTSLPSGVKIAEVDYDNEASLISALRDQQVLIISLAFTAAPDTHDRIVTAAAKAGVPHIMPNTWGATLEYSKLEEESILGATYMGNVRKIEELGLVWTSLCSSFWYEFSLVAQTDGYGFDVKNKKVTLYDEGDKKINTTTWEQCARAVAAWLSLKVIPEDSSDVSPTVSSWTNKPIYISSFLVSQKDMLASVQRVQGDQVKWEISHESVRERHHRGMGLVQKGDMSGFVLALYASAFFPGGFGDYETARGGKLDNEVLGLPKENLDEATARALEVFGSA